MASRQPVVFVSHGAPEALLKAPDAVACWRAIGEGMPRPTAILAVSAHWQARVATLGLAAAPATIHDFAGFDPALHRMQYPAPGAPQLAMRAAGLLAEGGVQVNMHPDRGLDHGAWAPLVAMFPEACIPVAQLSLTPQGPEAHLRLGQALAPLREEGVLILASGAVTHNFAWLDFGHSAGLPPLPRARAFSDWVADKLACQSIPDLLDYRNHPMGAAAHPSEEHFLPLFVALGAGMADSPVRFSPDYAYGGLAMDAYVWGEMPGLMTDTSHQP